MTDINMQENADDAKSQTLGMEHYLFYHATSLVKIVAGGLSEPERVFHIHEGLLVLRSDYFKSALNEHWPSAVEKRVNLPEENAQAFSAFARWIYNDLDLVPGDYLHAVKAYVLGEKLLARAFQDALVSEMEDNIIDTIYIDDANSISAIDAEDPEPNEQGPISMEHVVKLAGIIYEGTFRSDDPMKGLLLHYVAARMHGNSKCPSCGHIGVDTWDNRVKPWKADAMRILVDSGLQDFLCDVLVQIPRLCTPKEVE